MCGACGLECNNMSDRGAGATLLRGRPVEVTYRGLHAIAAGYLHEGGCIEIGSTCSIGSTGISDLNAAQKPRRLHRIAAGVTSRAVNAAAPLSLPPLQKSGSLELEEWPSG